MSAAFIHPPFDDLPRKRFTREEVERMLNTGIFEGQRWELIDGELIDKMGQNPPHASTVQKVLAWLVYIFDGSLVRVQLPMETRGQDRDRSVPEPDAAVLRESKAEFERRHPRGDEIQLAVEVADTSASFDLSRKATLYANAGVQEYWVIDLNRRMVVIYRQPSAGEFRQVQLFGEEETVSIEGRTETIVVRDLLPKL